MKKIFILLCCLAGLFIPGKAQQQATAGKATGIRDTTLSHRITQKMADSLQISPDQRRQIHLANLWIDSSKVSVIRQYHGTGSLNIYMNKLERMRDSLFQHILTDKQFVRYGAHKRQWVLNN